MANRATREIFSHCRLMSPTTFTTALLEGTRWTPRFVSGLLRPFTATARVSDRINETITNSSINNNSPVKSTSSTTRIRGPWTERENEILRSKIQEGIPLPHFQADFPLRSVSALATQIYKLRKIMKAQSQKEGIESTILRKSNLINAWSKAEDDMLIQVIPILQEQQSRQLPQQQGHPAKSIDWTLVAETKLNGKRLGRTSSSCQRRWDILNPNKTQRQGRWIAEEDKLFMKALSLQVPAVKDLKPVRKGGEKGKIERAMDLASLDLKSINWEKVSRVVGTRSATRCRSHLYTNLMSRNSGRWTPEELGVLQEGLRQHGRDWVKLEELVGTRSAYQIKKMVFAKFK